MDPSEDSLLDLVFDVIGAHVGPAPGGLRSRIVDAALAERMTPTAACRRTAAELDALLGSLGAHEWSAALEGTSREVRDAVLHLLGVERYLLGQLGRGPSWSAPRLEDHYPATVGAAADLAEAPSRTLQDAWRRAAADAVRAATDVGPEQVVVFHGLPMTARTLLVVRTFEIWTHGDDIRRATRRPLNLLDAARLSLMSSELLRVLPFGMLLRKVTRPGRTAQVDLRGPGGGSTVVALAPDEAPGDPDVVVSLGALELCRLASNRARPDDVDIVVTGDAALLEPMLVGAAAFAVD